MESTGEDDVFSRCIFCRRTFPENHRLPHFPWGMRVAFDPDRGRLWVVCEHCHRWNLCPLEGRHEALYELERSVRGSATPVTHTANITLFKYHEIFVIRVGDASLVEQAWWRYGRELQRRKRSFDGHAARFTAYAFGAMHFVGQAMGLSDPAVDITWDDSPVADILRWRRFGWAAWHGRTDCPYCGSTLRALRYDLSWWVYPLHTATGHLEVGVPCQRCDPWTPENVHVIAGPEAENVLRRCLAYQNIGGASERAIRDASRVIEDAGSTGAFARDAAARRQCLWKMGPTGAIAMEIALNESVEHRLMALEARALEFVWRREEELARIMDEELTPGQLLQEHLRRLPVRLSRRRPPHPGLLGHTGS